MSLKRSFKNQKADYNRQRRKVNGLSEDIQAMQQELAKMKAERVRILRTQGIAEEEVENMVDEDEFELMKRSKEAKRAYRRLFGKLEEQKRELESFSEQVETARRSLLDAFDDWVQKYLSKGLGTDFEEDVGEDMEEEGGGERMDDQEAFEQMERAAVMSQDPASMAFFLAKKTQKANKTQVIHTLSFCHLMSFSFLARSRFKANASNETVWLKEKGRHRLSSRKAI